MLQRMFSGILNMSGSPGDQQFVRNVRRRIDPPSSKDELNLLDLPFDVVGHTLSFLYFDEMIIGTHASKGFLHIILRYCKTNEQVQFGGYMKDAYRIEALRLLTDPQLSNCVRHLDVYQVGNLDDYGGLNFPGVNIWEENLCAAIINQANSLRKVEFSTDCLTEGIIGCLVYCPNLKELGHTSESLSCSSERMIELLSHCRQLELIPFNNEYDYFNESATGIQLLQLCEGLPLRNFTLKHPRNPARVLEVELVTKIRSLEYLHIEVDRSSLRQFAGASQGLHRLRSLKLRLRDAAIDFHLTEVILPALKKLVIHWRKPGRLPTLRIPQVESIYTDVSTFYVQDMTALLKTTPLLKTITLSPFADVDGNLSLWNVVPQFCPALRLITGLHAEQQFLLNAACHWKNVQSLFFCGHGEFNPLFTKVLLIQLPNLRNMNMMNAHHDMTLNSACQRNVMLELAKTPPHQKRIIRPNLMFLSILHCAEGLDDFICPNLKELRISSSRISCLDNFLSSLSNLEALFLEHLPLLKFGVPLAFTKLEHINLERLPNLTGGMLENIVISSDKIWELTVLRCDHIPTDIHKIVNNENDYQELRRLTTVSFLQSTTEGIRDIAANRCIVS